MKWRKDGANLAISGMSTTSHVTINRIELPTPFAVGSVNSFLLTSDTAAVLVDCGPNFPPAKEALLEGLRQQGLSLEDLTGLVLTHGHVDHVGLSATIQHHGVPIHTFEDVEPWLDETHSRSQLRSKFLLDFYRQAGMNQEELKIVERDFFFMQKLNDRSVVDVVLTPFAPLPLLPSFEVIPVPGHAQSALALFQRETGDMIIGDQLLARISSNAVVEPTVFATVGDASARTRSLLDYRENLQMLQALPIGRVFPGHGEVFEGAQELIERRLSDGDRRRQKIFELVTAHPGETPFSYAQRYYPRHVHEPSLILSEVIGYLDWLVKDGMLREQSNKSDGTFRFYP